MIFIREFMLADSPGATPMLSCGGRQDERRRRCVLLHASRLRRDGSTVRKRYPHQLRSRPAAADFSRHGRLQAKHLSRRERWPA